MGSKKRLRILYLFDLGQTPPEDQDHSADLKTPEWKDEAELIRTMEELGHEVKPFAVYNDVRPLVSEIMSNRPDLVFNQCEAFNHDRDYEANVAGLLEMMKVPFTGAGSVGLQMCKDKGLTKKILTYHRIPVPRFKVSRKARPLKTLKDFIFPAFVKPLELEASEGISQLSFAEKESDAIERVHFIHERFKTDAIVEEFIEGRELYVGVLGNPEKGKLHVFPPRELFFDKVPEGEPRIASYKVKWDEEYRRRWGIETYDAWPELEPVTRRRLNDMCRKVYRLFQMRGYGRMDLRLRPDGNFFFIEANPNPNLARLEDFAVSAESYGYKYPDLIGRIIKYALKSGNSA